MMMIKASFNKQQRKEYRIIISAATPPPPHSSAFLSVTASLMCRVNKKTTEERLRISAATRHRQASSVARDHPSRHQSGHIISLVRTRAPHIACIMPQVAPRSRIYRCPTRPRISLASGGSVCSLKLWINLVRSCAQLINIHVSRWVWYRR
jgi:hypothetical protein